MINFIFLCLRLCAAGGISYREGAVYRDVILYSVNYNVTKMTVTPKGFAVFAGVKRLIATTDR